MRVLLPGPSGRSVGRLLPVHQGFRPISPASPHPPAHTTPPIRQPLTGPPSAPHLLRQATLRPWKLLRTARPPVRLLRDGRCQADPAPAGKTHDTPRLQHPSLLTVGPAASSDSGQTSPCNRESSPPRLAPCTLARSYSPPKYT